MKRNRILIPLLLLITIGFVNSAYAQLQVQLVNNRNACGGTNGSIDIQVTNAVGNVSIFVFGPPNSSFINLTTMSGAVTQPVTGLVNRNYSYVVQDDNDNFGGFFTIANSPAISASVASQQNNTDITCAAPNGFININVSGGSGAYNFAWTGPNGFTASTQNISNLAGGSYSVTITDQTLNCTSFILNPPAITDPLPNTYTISTADAIICSNESLTIDLSDTDNGVTYTVMVDGVPTSTTIVGNGNPQSIVYSGPPTLATGNVVTVRAHLGLCSPVMMSGSINPTVNPIPVLVTPQTKAICTGENTAYEILLSPANFPAGTTFSWPDPDAGGPATSGTNVPMGTAGTTHINNVLTNATSSPITVTYTITPTSGAGCIGTPRNVVITVNPIPVLANPQTKTICSGANTAYGIVLNPANLPAGTTFSWADPDGGGPATAGVNVAMGAPGTTHINDVLTNTTGAAINVTYQVTASLGTCTSAVQNVVITVNPAPLLVSPQAKTICSGQNTAYEILLNPANLPTGTTFSWPDPDGAGPATSGTNVPMGTAGTTHINNILTNTTGSPFNVTYVITPTSGAGCPGAPQNVVITVDPAPVLVTPQTKTICSGQNTAYEILLNPLNLPAGTTFSWPDPDAGGPATAGVNVPMGTAGTTHINDVLTNATTAPTTVTYVVTPLSGAGCAGTPQNVVITVSPIPVLATPQTKTICSGQNTAYEILLNPLNLPLGTTFSWPDPDGAGPATAGVNVPMGTAGTTHINTVLTNTTGAAINVTYQVTASLGTCASAVENVVITVNPAPVLVTPQTKSICSGQNTAYEILLSPLNLPTGTTFSWPDPDAGGPATSGTNVPMGTAGTTHINNVLTNATTSPITVTYVVTPTSGAGCPGTPRNVVITVNPTPVLVTPQTKTICSGQNTAYEILLNPLNLPAGTTFSWADPDGGGPATAGVNVAMGTAGTTHINDVLSNATSAPITVTYVVTPTSGAGCPGTPQNVVITVNPIPVLATPQTKTICSGQNTAYEILLNPLNLPAGTTFSWPDPDGAGPATAGVNVPMGTAGTTHINNVLTNTTGAAINVTYQVTASLGTCTSAVENVVITVDPAPVLVTPQTKTICSGDNVNYEILLTPANLPLGTVFNWPDPDAGGPATAGVNVAMGTAGTLHITDVLTNATTSAITVTYVVTPTSGAGCPGTPRNVVITVNPTPVLATSQAKTICSGQNTAYEILLNPLNLPAGTTFSWPDPDGAGPATAGVNVPMGTAGTTHINTVFTNTTGAPFNVTYQVTASLGTCTSAMENVVITVNPEPVLVTPQTKTICSGDNTAYEILLNPLNLPAGTTFSWPDPDAGGPATSGTNVAMGTAGTTHINDNLTNTTGTAFNVTYVITPMSGAGCPGTSRNVVITVNPEPVLVTPQTKTICSGQNTAYEILLNPLNLPAGTTFSWPDPDAGGPATAGVNVPMGTAGTTHINDVLTNATTAPTTVTYVITPMIGAGCPGTPQNVVITVNPIPVLATSQTKTICSGQNTAYEILLNPLNLPAGTTFSWLDPDGAGPATAGANVPMGTAGTTHINNVLTNTTGAAINVTYQVTASLGTCTSAVENVVITVDPAPVLVTPQTKTICSGDNTNYEILLNPLNLPVGTTFSWPDPDGGGPATSGTNVAMGVAGTLHITDVLSNTTGTAFNVTYVVTPMSGAGCLGTPRNVVITVNPAPVLVTPQTKTICSGDNTNYEILLNPLNLPVGTTFSWLDPDGAGPATAGVNVPMGTAGTTHINDVLTNTTGAAINVTYVIIPTSGANCVGASRNVVITVDPAPALATSQAATICSGDNTAFEIVLNPLNLPAGTTFSWPDPDGLGPATAGTNVPMGAAGTTHINDVLTNTTGSPFNVTYVITPTSGAGCDGAPQNVVITVNPEPVLVASQAKTICSGDNTDYEILLNPLNLPAGTTFSWPDPDGTGPATAGASVAMGVAGTKHISDVLTNLTNAPFDVTYVITPTSGNGCVGASQSVVITINPEPVGVDDVSVICTASSVNYDLQANIDNLGNAISGVTFSWIAAAHPNVTGESTVAQSGSVISDVLTTLSNAGETVVYTVTPTSASGCVGATFTVSVTVSQQASAFAGNDQSICSGSIYALTGATLGGIASNGTWTFFSQPTGGDGNLSNGGAVINPASVTFTATVPGVYELTLTTDDPAGACTAGSDNVRITVTSPPVLAANQSKQICGTQAVAYEILTNPVNSPLGTTFSWPDPDGAGPATAGVNVAMGAAGTIHINDVLTNTTSSSVQVTYVVTPSIGACVGTPENIVITINPTPTLASAQTKTICSGENVAYEIVLTPANQPSGTLLSWPDPDGPGPATSRVNVPIGVAGTLHINDQLFNSSSLPILVRYVITASTGSSCSAPSSNIDIIVNPGAVVGAGVDKITCPEGVVILSGSTVGGLAATATWSIVSGPVGGDGVLSNSSATPNPSGVSFTAKVSGDYVLRLMSADPPGACPAIFDELTITVLDKNDLLCKGGNGGGNGGNVNCTVFTINVVEKRPTCGGQDDGEITLTVSGGTPSPNYVLTLYDSTATPIFTKAVVVAANTAHKFDQLSASTNYFYQVDDGTNVCRLPYSLPLQTTVQATLDLASVTNPTCFGSATGSAIINASGSGTGQYFYSLDNLTWKSFVPGTPGQIADLPPLGTYNILVGESIGDVCHTSVEVTVNSVNPDINATFSITPATCDGADGAITNIVATGGAGSGYQFSIDGINYKSDNNFTALVGGFYSIRVRDNGGCEKIVPANVTFPGFINFSYTVLDPTCSNNGNSGAIIVKVLDPGTYRIAVSQDQFDEPADADYKNYSDPFITFNDLSRGTYFIYAKTTGTVCPTRSEPIGMQGAYALSFGVQPTCVANDLSLTLTDIVGEPGVAYEFRVYRKSTGVLVETIQRASISATATEFLEYQQHTFLRNADDYRIQMVQTSPSTNCEITSQFVDVVIPNEVFALIGATKQSYPDIANGSLEVTNITGGATPYQVRIELDSAASFNFPSYETNFTEPNLNANNQFAQKYDNIPPGRYMVQVTDNVGCVLELMARVKMDQTVYIPNIFTPNGDNVNDIFFIRNLPSDKAELVVTSRWGKEVFSTKNYQNNWNGEGAADGVYFYQLSIGGSDAITGWVEILRGEKP